jgi:hypothetical protein
MVRMLSTDLISRLKSRAASPDTRTDTPRRAPETSYLGGAFTIIRVGLDGEPPPGPAPLPPPVSTQDVATAEGTLGFALPEELKQLYREVANGGLGPSGGLASLERVAERHRDLLADPPGEGGQEWPGHLLPINLSEPGSDCYDRVWGRILCWDEESLADGPGDDVWERSFRIQADSLSAWLEGWLSSPPMGGKLSRDMEALALEGLRRSLAYWRAMTPEQRVEMGLPEEGWKRSSSDTWEWTSRGFERV